MAKLDRIVDQLSQLTVIEAADLAKKLEDKWGVIASPGVAAIAVPQAETKADNPEEKTEYDVVLEAVGDKKINVIKEVKVITGLGLMEAKKIVESSPNSIKASVSREEAEKLKKKLEAAGAKVSLK